MTSVNFRDGARASALLHEVLSEVREAVPAPFEGLRWPKDGRAFRKDYAGTLVAFERRRLASAERLEVARRVVEAAADRMVFGEGPDAVSLAEHLAGEGTPLPVERIALRGSPGLVPETGFRGAHYEGAKVGELADAWLERAWMTKSAHRAVRWTLQAALESSSGKTDLVGQKIVSLGAGAELSPTRAMLRAGADVLWIDAKEPPKALLEDPRVAGSITHVPGGSNLLTQPREIAATIRAFAAGDPVHIGLYAYAGGAAMEWRLTAAMNAIVRSLPAALVRSNVLLISPTTPGTVSAEDAEAAAERRGRGLFNPLGLGRGQATQGQSGDAPHRVSHSIIELQGVSYQAAQYIGKMLMAETLMGDGRRVSAPVAPITRTASLAHPVFEVAFEGAGAFGILVSEPQVTRVLCAMVALHDLLNPDAPSARGDVAGVLGEQIHGGVYAQPYQLGRSIFAAAGVGGFRKPALVGPALRFAFKG
ncbi:MAG: hypothetical protein AAGH15_05950 [Myxococcota bacterium]